MSLDETIAEDNRRARLYGKRTFNFMLGGLILGSVLGYVSGGKVHDHYVKQGKAVSETRYKDEGRGAAVGGSIGAFGFLLAPYPRKRSKE